MSVSADYLRYVLDQLAPFATVTTRRMFGAVGLYAQGLFFGLIDDDVLYFKVDETNRADYAARGSVAFMPSGDPEKQMKGYFQVPSEVLEDSDELQPWARRSLAVAAAAAQRHSKRGKAARAVRKKSAPRRSKH
jgi:DNA transformation protein and related proteins